QEIIQAIDQLAAQAERAGELVQRMRQLGGRGTPRRSRASVEDLIENALRMLRADLDTEHVSRRLHIPRDFPKIFIDCIQIEQVLVNLIRNSIQAMSDMPLDQRILTITASQENGEAVVVVNDTER